MNELGVVDVILKTEITRTPDEISLSQSLYVNTRKIQEIWDRKEYKLFSPTHPPSQEYMN